MEDNFAAGCSICNEDFDDNERCPRLLPCFHCFCTQCITRLIQRGDKTCPFCRQNFRATSAQHLSVNFTHLELLQSMKDHEIRSASSTATLAAKSGSGAPEVPKSRSEMVELMKENICKTNSQHMISVQTAENNIKRAIESNNKLKREISVNQSKLEYEIINRLKSLANSCNMKMKYIDEVNAALEGQLKEIKGHESNLSHAKEKLDAATKLVQIDEAVDHAEACNGAVQNWLQILNSVLSRDEEVQQGFEKNTKSIQEKILSMKEIVDSPFHGEQGYVEKVAATLLKTNFKAEMVKRMDPGKTYYPKLEEIMAIQTLDGKTRYAKFSIHENRLCLHSLRDKQPMPTKMYAIKHSDVISLVDPSFRRTFLDIGTKESTLGRILVSLTPDTKRAKNFFLLSSGESGPSYVNTVLLDVYYKGEPWEFVVGGDYECNTGEGGQEVVPGAEKEKSGVLMRPFLAGSLNGYHGDELAGKFMMTTADSPGCSYRMFGQIESGLDILRDTIANHPNIRDVRIRDCGIVLDF